MATEIERKFLLKSLAWKDAAGAGTPMRQGYIVNVDGRSVRVRVAGDKAWLSVKALLGEGLVVRREYDYPIPVEDGMAMLNELCGGVITKVRYRVPHEGHTWEIDIFEDANQGLMLAEIELSAEDEPFSIPPWVGEEVSNDPRYLNSYLAEQPFIEWGR